MRYTLEEAAKELRKTRRWLSECLRDHPVDSEGEPFFTPGGREKILRSTDITRIELSLRAELKCRASSGRRTPAKRRATKSVRHTSDAAWKLAAELTNDPSLLASSKKRS